MDQKESQEIERHPRHFQRYTYRFEPPSIYNVACMWALAAKARPNDAWRRRALRVLGVALAKDPESFLWDQAVTDEDLVVLGDETRRRALLDGLRRRLTDPGIANGRAVRSLARIERIVDEMIAHEDGAAEPEPARFPANEVRKGSAPAKPARR